MIDVAAHAGERKGEEEDPKADWPGRSPHSSLCCCTPAFPFLPALGDVVDYGRPSVARRPVLCGTTRPPPSSAGRSEARRWLLLLPCASAAPPEELADRRCPADIVLPLPYRTAKRRRTRSTIPPPVLRLLRPPLPAGAAACRRPAPPPRRHTTGRRSSGFFGTAHTQSSSMPRELDPRTIRNHPDSPQYEPQLLRPTQNLVPSSSTPKPATEMSCMSSVQSSCLRAGAPARRAPRRSSSAQGNPPAGTAGGPPPASPARQGFSHNGPPARAHPKTPPVYFSNASVTHIAQTMGPRAAISATIAASPDTSPNSATENFTAGSCALHPLNMSHVCGGAGGRRGAAVSRGGWGADAAERRAAHPADVLGRAFHVLGLIVLAGLVGEARLGDVPSRRQRGGGQARVVR